MDSGRQGIGRSEPPDGVVQSATPRVVRLRRAAKVIDAIFCAVYVPILALLVTDLAGADPRNPFVAFWGIVASPLVDPFRPLIWSPHVAELQCTVSCLAALVVCFVVHQAIAGVLQLAAGRPSSG